MRDKAKYIFFVRVHEAPWRSRYKSTTCAHQPGIAFLCRPCTGKVASPDAMQNPSSLAFFVEYARTLGLVQPDC
jgi:hypothetical protein